MLVKAIIMKIIVEKHLKLLQEKFLDVLVVKVLLKNVQFPRKLLIVNIILMLLLNVKVKETLLDLVNKKKFPKVEHPLSEN